MFQAGFANKLAEIANEKAENLYQQSKIANDQQAVIVTLLLALFVVFCAAFVIKVRHSALSTIFIQLYHLLTHFAHLPKQQQ